MVKGSSRRAAYSSCVLLLIISGLSFSCKPQEEIKQPDVTITSKEFYKAGQDDEEGAKEKFGGKTIEISGKVVSVEKMVVGYACFLDGDGETGRVKCEFEDSHLAEKLKQGESVTLVGTVLKHSVGSLVIQGCRMKV